MAASSSVMAQNVILINGEPTKVILNDTSIVSVINEDVSDYMKGFKTVLPEHDKSFAYETYKKKIALTKMRILRKQKELFTNSED